MIRMEKDILKFFQMLRIRREKTLNQELLEKTKFEKELNRLEFAVNYETSSSSGVKAICVGGKRVVIQ